MSTVERLSITLPAEMARLIREKVEEGRYASNSEVIRDAMLVWEQREQARLERLHVVQSRINEADADPRPSLSEAELDRHFADRVNRALAALKDHA